VNLVAFAFSIKNKLGDYMHKNFNCIEMTNDDRRKKMEVDWIAMILE
jgi:hypothetical protein